MNRQNSRQKPHAKRGGKTGGSSRPNNRNNRGGRGKRVPADALPPKNKEINLDIEGVAFGGAGIARKDGKVYFVERTVEGDSVLAEVYEDKGKYSCASPVLYMEESEFRGDSKCRVSGRCGGCQWQGIDYEAQMKWKTSFVESALKRIGRLGKAEIIKHPSPDIDFYRNRVHLKGLVSSDGRISLGYFKTRTHDMVPIQSCPIASPVINSAIKAILATKAPDSAHASFKVELQALSKIDGSDPGVVATFFPEGTEDKDWMGELLDFVEDLDCVHWVGFPEETKDAPFFAFEHENGITYYTRPGQFQQVNMPANRILRSIVEKHVEEYNPKKILDVYCGSGNLSLALAKDGRYVEGTEFSQDAIDCAHHAVKENNLENTNYFSGNAVSHLWKVAKRKESFDMIIADPPRQGMYRAVTPLGSIAAETLIYVSCDPTTLARDLGKLCRRVYQLETVHVLDFFPNTFHVESVAILRRRADYNASNEPDITNEKEDTEEPSLDSLEPDSGLLAPEEEKS